MSQFVTSTAGGFVACRKIGGGTAIQKTFAVSASTNQAFFMNDAVTLKTSGKVAPLKTTTSPLGVISALMGSSGGKPIPLRFSQPTNGPYLTSGQAGFAVVNIDDKQTYVVAFGGTVNEAIIGGAAKVSAGAPNTQTGISGQSLGSTISTSADADAQFQIIGFAPVEMLSTRTSAAAPGLVEVKLVGGIFNGNPI